MSISTNVVSVIFGNSRRACGDRILHQRDRGQILTFTDLADQLPSTFQVWFANHPEIGTAVPQTGSGGNVAIPDTLVATGQPIWAWLYLHTGADDGETCYTVMILNTAQPAFTGATPTPSQASAWDEAIAELNEAIETADAAASHGPQIRDGYWYTWDPTSGSYVDSGVRAVGENGRDAVVDPTLSHPGEAADAAETGKIRELAEAVAERVYDYSNTIDDADITVLRGKNIISSNNLVDNENYSVLYLTAPAAGRYKVESTSNSQLALRVYSSTSMSSSTYVKTGIPGYTGYTRYAELEAGQVLAIRAKSTTFVASVSYATSSTVEMRQDLPLTETMEAQVKTLLNFPDDLALPISAAHRGLASAGHVQNTMPAYEDAVARGWRYLETDIRKTADDVWVLLHDATIAAGVNIADITYAQALTYDLGGGTHIATLEELLILCRRAHAYPIIEIKDSSISQADADAVWALLEQYEMEHCVFWLCSSVGGVSLFLKKDPYAPAICTSGTSWSYVDPSSFDQYSPYFLNYKTGLNKVFYERLYSGFSSKSDMDNYVDFCEHFGVFAGVYGPTTQAGIDGLSDRLSLVTSEVYKYEIERADAGGGGTGDYSKLTNKPSIAGVTLSGNKSLSDLGAEPEALTVNVTESGGTYSADYTYDQIMAAAASKRVVAVLNGVEYQLVSAIAQEFTVAFAAVREGTASYLYVVYGDGIHLSTKSLGTYTKPSGGIPKEDLAANVQASLDKADNALPKSGGTMTGPVDMGESKISNLAPGTNDADAVTLSQMSSAISQSSAYFRGSFATRAALLAVAWQTTDPAGQNYVTNNDYAVVQDDETQNDECWRYLYVSGTGWTAQYKINETPLTQAQLDALNSGATASNISAIAGKITAPASANVGDFLVYSADGWEAQTVPSAQGVNF